jgi:hypothetical protein
MNRAEKGWQTRYINEIAILTDKMTVLSDELYKIFLEFVNKTGKFQDMNREREAMQKELERFQARTKGGVSSE